MEIRLRMSLFMVLGFSIMVALPAAPPVAIDEDVDVPAMVAAKLQYDIERLEFLKRNAQKINGMLPPMDGFEQLGDLRRLLRDVKTSPDDALKDRQHLVQEAKGHSDVVKSGPVVIVLLNVNAATRIHFAEDPNIARALGRSAEIAPRLTAFRRSHRSQYDEATSESV